MGDLKPIIDQSHDEFYAEITDTGEGFRLWWTDGVANDWVEVYPDLATAVARLALLNVAVAEDRMFTGGKAAWFTRWHAFSTAWHDAWRLCAESQLTEPFDLEAIRERTAT